MEQDNDKRLREKISALAKFLQDKYQIELDRALSLKPLTINKIIKGEKQASTRILKKISE